MGLYIQPNVAPPFILVHEEHLGGHCELLHLKGHGRQHKLQLAATPL